jgi:hypothetical protein
MELARSTLFRYASFVLKMMLAGWKGLERREFSKKIVGKESGSHPLNLFRSKDGA